LEPAPDVERIHLVIYRMDDQGTKPDLGVNRAISNNQVSLLSGIALNEQHIANRIASLGFPGR
jgi:hypothetical protein